MRILQVIQKPQLRGAEIFACQLSTELVKNGFQVDVVYIFNNENATLDFNLHFIPLNGNPQRRLFDINAYRRLANIIQDGHYEIVQANAGDTLKYAVLSKTIFRWRAKLVFRNANRMTSFIHSPLQKVFNKWLLSRCDFFISVSENSRTDLSVLFPPATNKSISIPPGTYIFDSILPAERKVPRQEPLFLAVSSFVPEKNHVFILEIFHLYYNQNGKGILWLVGDGKLNALLKKRVQELNLSDRVDFLGYRKDVIPILKSADVFLMPSLIEGLPGVILEAMSCEIPVVASAVGGIPEVIENDVTGICILNGTAEEYVRRISRLLNDFEYKSRLVRQAKIKLLEKFIVEKVAVDFGNQYKKLIKPF